MSGEEVKIAGAICAPPAPSEQEVPQPRQPSSLQGLLKFAMEATKSEDAPHNTEVKPMDEEKRKFLQEALSSLSVDVVELLVKQMKTLETVAALKAEEDATKYIDALEVIADYVDDIDTANDFHKIGGFKTLQPCMRCKNAQVRALACNLLAELCQNNPYCQQVAVESNLIPLLITLVEDEDPQVVVKAIYALSCLARANNVATAHFIQHQGIQTVLKVLKSNSNEKGVVKICFLLSALCDSYPDFKNRLVFMGFVQVLFGLLEGGNIGGIREHVLMLLAKLLQDNPSVLQECRLNSGCKEVVEKLLLEVEGKDEFYNEESYCRTILNLLFPPK